MEGGWGEGKGRRREKVIEEAGREGDAVYS